MRIRDIDYYSVGPDDLGKYYQDWNSSYYSFSLDNFFQLGFKWIVCWYREDGYDGQGIAVALDKNGRFFVRHLDHCSCFEPLEGGTEAWKEKSLPSFFEVSENALAEEIRPEIKNKMKELLGLVEVVSPIDLQEGDYVRDSHEQFFVIVERCGENRFIAFKTNLEPYWAPHLSAWAIPTPKCIVEVVVSVLEGEE